MWLALSLAASAQTPSPSPNPRAEYIRGHYSKYEYRIPMRDGTRLFTSVYVPVGVNQGETYPMLLVRTPYSVAPYGLDRYPEALGPTAAYEQEGFIFVFQDVRGRWMSEGQFVNMRPVGSIPDDRSDTYDTLEWLLHRVGGHNGRAGMWGISYPGFFTAVAAIDTHPALVALSPQAPIADWWKGDDMHRNGAFNLHLAFSFLAFFGQPRTGPSSKPPTPFEFATHDAYAYYLELGPLRNAAKRFGFDNVYWQEMTEHPNYDDFWQARNLLPHLKNVRGEVMIVGGWFDAEDLYGPLHIFQSIRALNPAARCRLVMGPWSHGGWLRTDGSNLGDADFGFKTALSYQEWELAYFKHLLKGAPDPKLPTALVFETGANRWRSFSNWPPPARQALDLYLGPDNRLLSRSPEARSAADSFPSDPAHPVPYTRDFDNVRMTKNYMAEDQRFAATRPDVLTYRGPALTSDLTVAGPIEVDLWASTTGTDADWIVKLVDEAPGDDPKHPSQLTLIRGEPYRGRFRHDPSRPQPFEPGRPARIRYQLNDVMHTFLRGHRVVVQVQSTWFPYIDRNPQKFVPNIFAAGPSDFISAVHRVYRDQEHPSHIRMGILPAADQSAAPEF